MANFFYKLAQQLQRGAKDFLDVPVAQERAFLAQLPEPASDVQRSYNQYLCQNFYRSRLYIWCLNFVSAGLFPFVLLVLLLKGCTLKRRKADFDAICDLGGFRDVIPEALSKEFRLDYDHWFKNSSLSLQDVPFVCRTAAFRPLSCFFGLKCMLKVSYYSDMLRRYEPKTVVTHNEYAFSSSVLTAYCQRRGVEHINVMHGEKLLRLRDTFFRFHRSYVWDEHYVKLFKQMRATKNNFILYTPAAMCIDVDKHQSVNDYADVKYYLQVYNKEEITTIVAAMEQLKALGYTVKYRPHPRYSDVALLKTMVDEREVENPRKVGIATSVSNLRFAAGSFTTVLNQAYVSGKTVVMDDVTFPQRMQVLKERLYLFAEPKERCCLLSEMVKGR